MIETKFKETEVGRVPADWEVKTLGDVVYINPASEREKPDQFIYIDLESVKQGKLISTNMVNRVSAPSRAQRQIEQNDILYQTVRPYQSNNLYIDFDATKYIASTGYAVLRSHEDTDSRYVYMYLHTYKFVCDVLDNCTGTSYPAISPNKLAEISIILPSSLPEQRRIATALSDIDSLISSLDELIEKKRNIKQGAMQQLLTGKTRLKGFTEPWVEKKLGDLIKYLRTGLNPRTNFKLNTADAYGYYITVRELNGYNIIIDENTDRINDDALSRIGERAQLKINDVLFSGTGTIGQTAIVKQMPFKWGIKEGIYAITVDETKLNPLYLVLFLHTPVAISIFDSYASGSTIRSVPMAKMVQLPISLPSLSEQQAIASILTSMDDEIAALEQKREKYVSLKQGMMQELLTGRIRLV